VGAAVSAHGSAAAKDDSKNSAPLPGLDRASLAVLTLGVVGGVLLCLTEVTTVVEISVGAAVRAHQSGQDQHGLALLLLGVLALPLAWLATSARGGPVLAALAGLALLGLAALGLWALGDLPDTGRSGTFGLRSEPATAGPGLGFWLELAGALALMAASLVGLLRITPGRRSPG
jgi:hypothetical protein